MVLAVSDEDEVPDTGPLCVEHVRDHTAHGVSDQRASTPNGRGRDVIQGHSEEPVVHGQGALHDGRAGEHRQGDPIAAETFDGVADRELGTLETVRRQVLRQHAARDVQQEHHVPAGLRDVIAHGVPAGTGERHHEQGHAREE